MDSGLADNLVVKKANELDDAKAVLWADTMAFLLAEKLVAWMVVQKEFLLDKW